MVRRIQVHPIPAGLELKIGPQPLRTLDIGEPASGIRGANIGATAEPLHSVFVERPLRGSVALFPLAGSAPKPSPYMRYTTVSICGEKTYVEFPASIFNPFGKAFKPEPPFFLSSTPRNK